jgi:transcriptional regulator with PAS, ATPase and Fis domain
MGVPPVSDEDCQRAAEALRTHNGNQAAAADEVGISRSTFQNWVKS